MKGRPGDRAALFVVARRVRVAHNRAMRIALLLSLLLVGCSSANRTDGVTPSEAVSLNAAAERLDAPPTDPAPPKPN